MVQLEGSHFRVLQRKVLRAVLPCRPTVPTPNRNESSATVARVRNLQIGARTIARGGRRARSERVTCSCGVSIIWRAIKLCVVHARSVGRLNAPFLCGPPHLVLVHVVGTILTNDVYHMRHQSLIRRAKLCDVRFTQLLHGGTMVL